MARTLSFLLSFFFVVSVQASTKIYYIYNYQDSGPNSLREAITLANNNVTDDVVVINFSTSMMMNNPCQGDSPGTYTTCSYGIQIQSPLPSILKNNIIITSDFDKIYIEAISESAKSSYGISRIDSNGFITTILQFDNQLWQSIFYQGFKSADIVVTNSLDKGEGSLLWAQSCALSRSSLNIRSSISFNIPEKAPHIIDGSKLSIDKLNRFLIDGSTQPENGYKGISPKIIITNSNLSLSDSSRVYGIWFQKGVLNLYGKNIRVGDVNKGNVFTGGKGIRGGDVFSYPSDIDINSNLIGVDTSGYNAIPNDYGIQLGGYSITIQNNVISGNTFGGIIGQNPTSGTSVNNQLALINSVIKRNKIGVSIDGNNALPNGMDGVMLSNPVGVILGGDIPLDGNVISGNKGGGVNIRSLCTTCSEISATIKNNIIGLSYNGENSIANTGYGIMSYNRDDNGIKEKIVIQNNKIATNTGKAIDAGRALIRGNSIYNNQESIAMTYALEAPIIKLINEVEVSGTATNGSFVQLFYDNGFNEQLQGKDYIGDAKIENSGLWQYSGIISKPGNVIAIALDTVNKLSSVFSGYQLLTTPIGEALFPDFSLSIYPNPAKNVLYIKKSIENPVLIKLMDINGRICLEHTCNAFIEEIALNDQKQGFYILEALYDKNLLKRKIIIE